MKNTFLTAATILALSIGANAQTITTDQTASQPATTQQPASTTVTTTATTTVQQPATTAPRSYGSTVDSIRAKYQYLPMPEAWTAEKTYPVLGSYQLNGETTSNITITLDSTSKGIVWISGLPQGTVKAYLAKSPATYRIVPQKTPEGKSVPEGTLVFTPESNTLNIALGAPYNSENPTAIFPVPVVADTMAVDAAVASAPSVATVKVKTNSGKSKVKSKSKVTFYTASKVAALNATQSNAAFGQQLDQAAQKQ